MVGPGHYVAVAATMLVIVAVLWWLKKPPRLTKALVGVILARFHQCSKELSTIVGLDELHLALHLTWLQQGIHCFQGTNDLADRAGLLMAVCDSGMRQPARRGCQEVGIVCHQYAAFAQGKIEMLFVAPVAQAGIGRGCHVDTSPPQSIGNR